MWRGETSDRGGKSYRSDVPFGEYLGGFVSRLCFSFSTSWTGFPKESLAIV